MGQGHIDPPIEERRKKPEPTEKKPDEVRCPDCGAEEGIIVLEHPSLPPERAARCDCGYVGDPLKFHYEWKWERMTGDEREAAREAREGYEDDRAEYQHSTTHISEQREP